MNGQDLVCVCYSSSLLTPPRKNHPRVTYRDISGGRHCSPPGLALDPRSRTRSARPAAPRRRWSIGPGRRCWSAAAPPSGGVRVRVNVSRPCGIAPPSPSPGSAASRLRSHLQDPRHLHRVVFVIGSVSSTPDYLRPDRSISTPVLFSSRPTIA